MVEVESRRRRSGPAKFLSFFSLTRETNQWKLAEGGVAAANGRSCEILALRE